MPAATASASATLPPASNASSRKATKRKIDEALYNLDQALRSSDDIKQPPAKKTRFPASLYTTLAKYGIKTKSRFASDPKPADLTIIKNTAPHLSAILSRAASREEKAAHREELARASVANISTTTSSTVPVEYRPSSISSFLSRLSTYKLSTFSTKPSSIDAVAASKAGWINEGKERLLCTICKASWVLASRDGMTRDAANALVEKQRTSLVQAHKGGCPWRTRQCDDSIYCIPLKSPSAMAKEIKLNAIEFDDSKVLDGVEIRHPLTSGQVQALLSALSSIRAPRSPDASGVGGADAGVQEVQEETTPIEPSQKAVLTAVFGWSMLPPHTETRPMTPSVARASTISHAPVPSSVPRRTGGNASSISAAVTSKPSRIPVPRSSSAVTAGLQHQETRRKHDDALLHCELCQRRIGLWTFKGSIGGISSAAAPPTSPTLPSQNSSAASTTAAPVLPSSSSSSSNSSSQLPARRVSQGPMPKRQFDLLKEHRSYCPCVVRSTIVPSLSTFASSTAPPRSVSSGHPLTLPRPTPSRSSSASSFNFSFSPRNAPQYPESSTLGDAAAVEGWRAVLTVVMRTGLGRRQRQRARMNVQGVRSASAPGAPELESGGSVTSPTVNGTEQDQNDDDMEVDNIHAMVEDVKKRGGRDLLRYVKSLFS